MSNSRSIADPYDMAGVIPHCLVPVDGSTLAEGAIAVAARIATPLQTPLTLLRVLSLAEFDHYSGEERGLSSEEFASLRQGERSSVQTYLTRWVAALQAAGCKATASISVGHVPSVILEQSVRSDGHSLIVLTSHAMTGLPFFALGGVAGLVVRASEAPVLLIRAHSTHTPLTGSILLPLDGSSRATRAVPYVTAIAIALQAPIVILGVSCHSDPDEREYLRGEASTLRHTGVKEVEWRHEVGNAAEIILRIADSADVGLVAITSHGQSRRRQGTFGAVADAVVHSAASATLLVPVRD